MYNACELTFRHDLSGCTPKTGALAGMGGYGWEGASLAGDNPAMLGLSSPGSL